MKDFFMDIWVGDKIYIDDDVFLHGRYATVTETKLEHDDDTSEPYKVICCGDHKFDARSGLSINPLGYFISIEN